MRRMIASTTWLDAINTLNSLGTLDTITTTRLTILLHEDGFYG